MIKWISHRGESIDAPENSLAAFKLSMERKTDGMECDVHLTTDGKVVVCHDASTLRTGSAFLQVEESSYAELQQIHISGAYEDIYPDEKIPLLSETFQYLGKDREYYIDLKGSNPELVPAVKAVVEASGVDCNQIVFIAFSETLVREIKKAMPQCRALWLNSLIREYGRVTAGELIAKLKELGVDGIDAAANPDTDAELIKAVHDAGMIYAVWTIDNPYQAQHFINMGVDAVTSNRAAKLKARYEGTKANN